MSQTPHLVIGRNAKSLTFCLVLALLALFLLSAACLVLGIKLTTVPITIASVVSGVLSWLIGKAVYFPAAAVQSAEGGDGSASTGEGIRLG
jgi:uncharacterized membrane protein